MIVGVGSSLFSADPRAALGLAIGAAESAKGKGRLDLKRWRKGKVQSVRLKLPILGEYEPTAPFDCAKSRKILDAACDHMAANMKGGIDGMMNALALLANGDRRHAGAVRDLARKVGRPDTELTLEGRTSGLLAWEWGYRAVFLCEYYLATKDRQVLPAIAEYTGTIARGQSRVGTWGHGMAWPDLNDGQLHGSLGGYGAVNQAGLVCHLALILAEKCGVKDREIAEAIQRANLFASFYTGKGAIPYGDHRPGWDSHDDNGKNSLAALIFDLQGMDEEAAFFGRMAVASYDEREQGHTGNYFSFLWGPIGANRVGQEALSAFLREQRWYYDLARAHDGSFPYQGGAGMSGGEHKYGKWDCTGAFVPRQHLPQAGALHHRTGGQQEEPTRGRRADRHHRGWTRLRLLVQGLGALRREATGRAHARPQELVPRGPVKGGQGPRQQRRHANRRAARDAQVQAARRQVRRLPGHLRARCEGRGRAPRASSLPAVRRCLAEDPGRLRPVCPWQPRP